MADTLTDDIVWIQKWDNFELKNLFTDLWKFIVKKLLNYSITQITTNLVEILEDCMDLLNSKF